MLRLAWTPLATLAALTTAAYPALSDETQHQVAQLRPAPVDTAPQGPNPASTSTFNKLGGRYQALALPRDPGTAGDKMMIIDTQTGDVWQWFDTPALSQYIGKTGLTYMGKLKPGTAPGETITFRRFDGGK